MWDPQAARWRDPGDHVLPHALWSLPQPWDECDWGRAAELPAPTSVWRSGRFLQQVIGLPRLDVENQRTEGVPAVGEVTLLLPGDSELRLGPCLDDGAYRWIVPAF